MNTRMINYICTPAGAIHYIWGCSVVGSTVAVLMIHEDVKSDNRRRLEDPLYYIGGGIAASCVVCLGAPFAIPVVIYVTPAYLVYVAWMLYHVYEKEGDVKSIYGYIGQSWN